MHCLARCKSFSDEQRTIKRAEMWALCVALCDLEEYAILRIISEWFQL